MRESGVLCFLHQLLVVNTLTLAILLANVISVTAFIRTSQRLAGPACKRCPKRLSSFLLTTQTIFVCTYRSAFSRTGYVQAETRWRRPKQRKKYHFSWMLMVI